MIPRYDLGATDEDLDIRLSLKINERAVPWLRTLHADERDGYIMARLARTRKNNKKARAYPEIPGELA